MKKFALTALAFGIFATSSCTKTGPQGPQGPRGYDGNANVVGSASFAPVFLYDGTSRTFYANFTLTALTSDVVNYGVFEVYKQYSDGTWTNLPDVNGVTATVYNFTIGSFSLYIYNTDGSTPAAPPTTNYRTVVITPAFRKAHPNTNWKNYIEVQSLLQAEKFIPATVTQVQEIGK